MLAVHMIIVDVVICIVVKLYAIIALSRTGGSMYVYLARQRKFRFKLLVRMRDIRERRSAVAHWECTPPFAILTDIDFPEVVKAFKICHMHDISWIQLFRHICAPISR